VKKKKVSGTTWPNGLVWANASAVYVHFMVQKSDYVAEIVSLPVSNFGKNKLGMGKKKIRGLATL